MSNFYVYLDSKDSINPATPYQCSFPLQLNFQLDYRNFVSLEEFRTINSVYPINSTNNTFVFRENSGVVDHVATVPAGSYNGTQIASALQTAMNSATPAPANTYTVSFNSITYKINITTTLPNTYSVGAASTILNKIGFVPDATFLTGRTGLFLVRLDGTSYIDIVTSIPCSNVATNGTRRVLKRVYIDVPFGSILFYEDSIPDSIPLRAQDFAMIDIQLFDDTGLPYLLPAECGFQMTLKFSTHSV
jgi:hypothetical protein